MNHSTGWQRVLAGAVTLGLALGPGMPTAFAQVEITPQIREACEQFPPDLREIALTEVVPKLEASTREDAPPEAQQEAKIVETTALAIRETTRTTQQVVDNPEQVAKNAVEALTKSGVPVEVATRIESQMKDALKGAKETLRSGGTVEDAAKYLEACRTAFEQASGYTGGKEFREMLAGGTSGLGREQSRSMEFLGAVVDPKAGDVMKAAMEAHFAGEVRSAIYHQGSEGGTPSAEAMRGVMEQMVACGIDPRGVMNDVYRGAPGEFHGPTGEYQGTGPSPEAVAAMTPEQRQGYEAWKSGDLAKMQELQMHDALRAGTEAGMPVGDVAREIMNMETMRAAMEAYHSGVESGRSPTEIEAAWRDAAVQIDRNATLVEHYITTEPIVKDQTQNYDNRQAEQHDPPCANLTPTERAMHQAHGHCP